LQPPRLELIRLREKHYPGVTLADFGKLIGITRLHVVAVERGRRRPSMDLLLRWLSLLPGARFDMFGDLPTIEKRVRMLRKIQQISPKAFAA
jgi:transcriptional regulator with XRE-family HTH domain